MGMTAQQRFLLSVMLLITVCVMGVLAMVITGKNGFLAKTWRIKKGRIFGSVLFVYISGGCGSTFSSGSVSAPAFFKVLGGDARHGDVHCRPVAA